MDCEVHTYGSSMQTTLPDILLVPGAGHTAACWDYVLPLFNEANIRVHTMNFRGHGECQGRETVRSNRLWDYVDDVRSAILALRLTTRPFVLAAHSMGGYVVQVALQQQAMPGLVGVILLSTLTPRLARHPLVALNLLSYVMRHGRATISTLQSGDFYSLCATEKSVKYLFFSKTTPTATLQFCRGFLQSDSLRVFLDITHATTPERGHPLSVPVQVIGAQQDHIIPIRLLYGLATVYGVQPTVVAGGHDVMLDIHYADVADAMIRWMGAPPTSPS